MADIVVAITSIAVLRVFYDAGPADRIGFRELAGTGIQAAGTADYEPEIDIAR